MPDKLGDLENATPAPSASVYTLDSLGAWEEFGDRHPEQRGSLDQLFQEHPDFAVLPPVNGLVRYTEVGRDLTAS